MRAVLWLALALGAELAGLSAQAPAEEGKLDPAALLRAIEQDMAAVEALLLQADPAAAAARAAEAAAKLDRLLGEAHKRQEKIIADLDRLIREVERRQREAKQCLQGAPRSRRDRARGRRPEDQRSPRARRERRGREENRQPRRPDVRQDRSRRPPPQPQAKIPHPDKKGRWGVLPQKFFELLTQPDQVVFPPDYYEYLMEYYRRLAEGKVRRL